MKKHLMLYALLLILSFTLAACDLTPATTISTTFLTSSETVTASTSTTTLSPLTTTTTTTTQTTTSTTQTTISTEDGVPFIPTDYTLLQDELDVIGIPSTGEVKVLVFAVDFVDFPSASSNITIEDIDTAFNGDSAELTYESLNSYYDKSSYGQLDLTADIYGFYRASQPASYYEDEYDKLWATDQYGNWLYDDDEVTYPDSDLIYELLQYYDDQIDYSDYDSNGDGYIDGVYVVYTHPVSYLNGSDLWWAYQDVYIYEGDVFDGVEPYYFVWSGTEFFEEGSDNINARTIIHESGHMMGLDDYYDYYDADIYHNSGGLGGADMMDYAVGDHGAFSKLILGWIRPIVVETSMTVDIRPFLEAGEVILLTEHWNGTIFDEYLLISYFVPEGLNDDDPTYLFSTEGIVIYHVSAKIGNGYDENSYYYSIFNYNNTDTVHKLIKIIEADMDGDIDRYSDAENSDLFQEGDILGSNIYSTYKWYDNTALGITIEIVSITSDSAEITITFIN